VAELAWGRRFLMCPPEHFGVLYEINPWMHREVEVDRELARQQWESLVATLRAAGAEVEVQDPHPDVPDLVFTANAGLVNGNEFVPSRFRHPERQGETAFDIEWFSARGFSVRELPPGLTHEGAGDALPFVGVPVRAIELVEPRLYHVDLTFCPLDDRRAMIAPSAWDSYGCKVVEALVPEPLVLERDEALAFVANSVVVGTTIVMPSCPVRVGRQLEAWGFDVVEVSVTEFLKAGGGCRCLTLALDVDLGA
jgi:N-dimethylarginine dimethylaminohydrolase